jgi:hypothetical protein
MKNVYIAPEVGSSEISIKGTPTIEYQPCLFAIAQPEMVILNFLFYVKAQEADYAH